MKFSEIFNLYKTKENKEFYLYNKSINFPEDKSLDIYDTMTMGSDTPWTLLSYKIYNTIDYWWVLTSINKSSVFYAKEGDNIYFIKPVYIELLLQTIKEKI